VAGTMGNLLGVMTHCNERSSELIIGNKNHLVIYEQGGMATIGNIHPRQLRTETEAGKATPIGGMALEDIEDAMRPLDDHFPITRLVCLENSHNLCGGSALPLEYIDAVGKLCKKWNVKLHMDGARIFNAAAAVGEPVDRLCAACDSVSVCLRYVCTFGAQHQHQRGREGGREGEQAREREFEGGRERASERAREPQRQR